MHHAPRNRRGIGLPIAMGAMVIIGIVIAAGAFASMHDYRIDRNTLFQERALGAAEEGQARIVRDWTPAWNSLAVGDTLPPRDYTMPDGSSARVVVTRLNTNTFWVMSDGAANQTSRQLNARRRTNLILRLHVPNLRIPGAVSAREGTRATGSATLNGDDRTPTGWNCDPVGPPAGAIATDSIGDSGVQGACADGSCLTTAGPATRVADSLLRDTATFSQYGGLNYDSLKAQSVTAVGKVYDVPSGGLTLNGLGPMYYANGDCLTTHSKNMGDPYRNALLPGKCETYFPVVYLRGPATATTIINGGVGQGLMIVDGNLQLSGNFEWYGPIIVRGNFGTNGTMGGTGVKVFGGVLAANLNCNSSDPVGAPCNNLSGNSRIQFSRCAINAAITQNARTVLATRSWADLF